MQLTDRLFEEGYTPEDYVDSIRNYRSLLKTLVEEADATPERAAELASATKRFAAPVRATMATEDWCGDAVCNLPVLIPLFEKAGIPFRVLRGSEHPDLKAFYNDRGLDHIPRVSLWDGNGKELMVWVEKPAAVAPKQDAWKKENPTFYELYENREKDKESAKEWAAMYRRYLEAMADWYRQGMWRETEREIVELLAEARVPH